MCGVKQRTKQTPTGAPVTASPTVDSNEEYYGYGNSSPIEGTGDKDYRNRAADSTDKVAFLDDTDKEICCSRTASMCCLLGRIFVSQEEPKLATSAAD
ncbi:unnamed protein product [Gongylonema pulchrum]|uniref:Overexpressed in colon carcinoma 1 protein n=1 Tax=Gongylonema pulchrum TaxID=637853 RepID=A0A183EEL5_9BILA|nr:unnamed protein product [Gongylonema pulchrum]